MPDYSDDAANIVCILFQLVCDKELDIDKKGYNSLIAFAIGINLLCLCEAYKFHVLIELICDEYSGFWSSLELIAAPIAMLLCIIHPGVRCPKNLICPLKNRCLYFSIPTRSVFVERYFQVYHGRY